MGWVLYEVAVRMESNIPCMSVIYTCLMQPVSYH